MSGEIGVVMLAPAVIPIALLGGLVAGGTVLLGKAADAAIERERRTREARWQTERAGDRYRALQRRVEAARTQFGPAIDPLPDLPGDLSPNGDPVRAASIAHEVTRRASAAEARLQAQLGAIRAARIVDALRRGGAALLVERAGAPGAGQRAAELADSLRRVLSRLDSGAPERVARQLADWATAALSERSAATALRLLDDLRYSVDEANRAVRLRRDRFAELTGRLREYAGPPIDAAVARLNAAADEPEPDWPALEEVVAAAVDETRAAALHEYTTRALRESLADIGCEVEEDFDVLLVDGGVAHVRRPGWDDLAVRVRTGPGAQEAHFNLVAPRDGAVELSDASEAEWCGAFDALVPALAERGIDIRITHRSEPGAAEVQPVDAARFPFHRSRRGPREEQRRRGLNR